MRFFAKHNVFPWQCFAQCEKRQQTLSLVSVGETRRALCSRRTQVNLNSFGCSIQLIKLDLCRILKFTDIRLYTKEDVFFADIGLYLISISSQRLCTYECIKFPGNCMRQVAIQKHTILNNASSETQRC